jgi:outer membrane receptor protein involved in Fe transport
LNAYVYYNDDSLIQPFARFQAAGANVPGFGSNYSVRYQQYSLSETWTINPSTVNEAHFTYFREGQLKYNSSQNIGSVQSYCTAVSSEFCFSDPSNPRLGIHPGLSSIYQGLPFISVAGGFSIGNDSEGQLPQIGNTFSWTDNLSKVIGSHSLKFGVNARRMRFDQTLYYNVNGSYTFNSGGTNDVGADNQFASYLLGLPSNYSQGSAQEERVRSTSLYLFAQDSWKIKPNLTLNYGLRWELNTPFC